MKSLPHWLCLAALLLCALGVLIFLEVLRPDRDMAIDGPSALVAWATGTALGVSCLFLKGRSRALSIVSLLANLLPLLAALVLIWAMSRSNFGWH